MASTTSFEPDWRNIPSTPTFSSIGLMSIIIINFCLAVLLNLSPITFNDPIKNGFSDVFSKSCRLAKTTANSLEIDAYCSSISSLESFMTLSSKHRTLALLSTSSFLSAQPSIVGEDISKEDITELLNKDVKGFFTQANNGD